MATKIQPIAKQETVNYGGRDVKNFWLPRSEGSHSGHKDSIKRLLQNVQNGFICVYSERLEDKDIIKLLFDLSERVRIYVLVNEYSSAMDILRGKVLIRYSGINNIGSFVLVNPNSNAAKGMFFGGQLTEGSFLLEHTSFGIVSNEAKELFRHFCYMFWERVKTEIIEKEEVEVKTKPFDIYYDTDKFEGKDYVYGTLFEFVKGECRKNIAGKNIVYCGNEKQLPIMIQAETTQDIGENKTKMLLPKEEFEAQKPEFKDDGVSVKINYMWTNVPFYLPSDAKKHNLYSQWETEKGKINQKLDSLSEAISALEKRENSVSSKLTRFFLGKKQQFNELKDSILSIKLHDFSVLAKEERNGYIRQINKISDSIIEHGIEIENENRKAKLQEEINEIDEQIKSKQQELTKKKEELADKKKNIKPDDKTAHTFIKKIEDEIQNIEKSIKNLENQKNSKQKEIEKGSDENRRAGSSLDAFSNAGNKQKNQSGGKSFELQNLPQLPQVGTLYQAGVKSFLAIEYWEDYEQGKAEAERLNAELCATK